MSTHTRGIGDLEWHLLMAIFQRMDARSLAVAACVSREWELFAFEVNTLTPRTSAAMFIGTPFQIDNTMNLSSRGPSPPAMHSSPRLEDTTDVDSNPSSSHPLEDAMDDTASTLPNPLQWANSMERVPSTTSGPQLQPGDAAELQLIAIFQRLDSRSLAAVARVCSKWRALAHDVNDSTARFSSGRSNCPQLEDAVEDVLQTALGKSFWPDFGIIFGSGKFELADISGLLQKRLPRDIPLLTYGLSKLAGIQFVVRVDNLEVQSWFPEDPEECLLMLLSRLPGRELRSVNLELANLPEEVNLHFNWGLKPSKDSVDDDSEAFEWELAGLPRDPEAQHVHYSTSTETEHPEYCQAWERHRNLAYRQTSEANLISDLSNRAAE